MALAFRNLNFVTREKEETCSVWPQGFTGWEKQEMDFTDSEIQERLADNWGTSVVKALPSLSGDRWPSTIMKESVPPASRLCGSMFEVQSPLSRRQPWGRLGKLYPTSLLREGKCSRCAGQLRSRTLLVAGTNLVLLGERDVARRVPRADDSNLQGCC